LLTRKFLKVQFHSSFKLQTQFQEGVGAGSPTSPIPSPTNNEGHFDEGLSPNSLSDSDGILNSISEEVACVNQQPDEVAVIELLIPH
jgi:hypothetical protein